MTSRILNAYEILAVSRTATNDEVRAAYRAKARVMHPDVSSAPNAAELFRQATEAREELLDPARRAELDRRLLADELRVMAKQDAAPFANSHPAQPSTDAISDLLKKFREEQRRREEARKKQQAEERERRSRAIREALAAMNSTARANRAHPPAQQNHTTFYSLAQSLSKSRPADERFVWSMLGLIADVVVAAR